MGTMRSPRDPLFYLASLELRTDLGPMDRARNTNPAENCGVISLSRATSSGPTNSSTAFGFEICWISQLSATSTPHRDPLHEARAALDHDTRQHHERGQQRQGHLAARASRTHPDQHRRQGRNRRRVPADGRPEAEPDACRAAVARRPHPTPRRSATCQGVRQPPGDQSAGAHHRSALRRHGQLLRGRRRPCPWLRCKRSRTTMATIPSRLRST